MQIHDVLTHVEEQTDPIAIIHMMMNKMNVIKHKKIRQTMKDDHTDVYTLFANQAIKNEPQKTHTHNLRSPYYITHIPQQNRSFKTLKKTNKNYNH